MVGVAAARWLPAYDLNGLSSVSALDGVFATLINSEVQRMAVNRSQLGTVSSVALQTRPISKVSVIPQQQASGKVESLRKVVFKIRCCVCVCVHLFDRRLNRCTCVLL